MLAKSFVSITVSYFIYIFNMHTSSLLLFGGINKGSLSPAVANATIPCCQQCL